MSEKTHFGFKDVDANKKASMVKGVFDSVADSYDLMNDVMSFGIHRLWKKSTIEMASLQQGQKVLDLASGTGDLTAKISPILGSEGRVVMSDINYRMLANGRDRMTDLGLLNNISFALANAEQLPFKSNYFDCAIFAFGLRNVTDKSTALKEAYRVLKSGAKLLVLEFSKPEPDIVNKFYDFYSFKILPKMGKLIAKDEDSYQYLAESIRKHPNQATLQQMFNEAGFEKTGFVNLSTGIVAIHYGYKF